MKDKYLVCNEQEINDQERKKKSNDLIESCAIRRQQLHWQHLSLWVETWYKNVSLIKIQQMLTIFKQIFVLWDKLMILPSLVGYKNLNAILLTRIQKLSLEMKYIMYLQIQIHPPSISSVCSSSTWPELSLANSVR